MLPLRMLVLPFESLSLIERAQALLLAREAADFAARLLGPGEDRPSGALVWQRLVVEEALLRQVIRMEDAEALMRRTFQDDHSDPRLDAFLSRWAASGCAAPSAPPTRALTLIDGAVGRRARSAAARVSRA